MSQAPVVDDGARRVLRVQAAGRSFAVDAAHVQAVERLVRWARLPGAPDYVRGVAEVRGRVVAVIDLASRLGLAPEGARPREDRWRGDSSVVVIESAEPVALAVDVLGAVGALGASREAEGDLCAAGVARVAADGALVLDVDAVVDGRALARLPAEARPGHEVSA